MVFDIEDETNVSEGQHHTVDAGDVERPPGEGCGRRRQRYMNGRRTRICDRVCETTEDERREPCTSVRKDLALFRKGRANMSEVPYISRKVVEDAVLLVRRIERDGMGPEHRSGVVLQRPMEMRRPVKLGNRQTKSPHARVLLVAFVSIRRITWRTSVEILGERSARAVTSDVNVWQSGIVASFTAGTKRVTVLP
jgi:hypothetical protein